MSSKMHRLFNLKLYSYKNVYYKNICSLYHTYKSSKSSHIHNIIHYVATSEQK